MCISYVLEKKRYDFSLDLKVPNELLSVTVCGRERYCVSVERHTICRWKRVAAVDDHRRPDACRWRGTKVRGQTRTRRQTTLVCSQRVSVQEASATAAKSARYGRVIRLQSEAEQWQLSYISSIFY